LRLHSQRIPAEWVDFNGHVNESRYLQVLTDASDAFIRYLGVDAAYLAGGCSYFTAETHLSFLAQTHAEDVVDVSTQVLAGDEKRLHLYHRLERPIDGAVLAESETMLLHVDTRHGKVAPAGAGVAEHVRQVAEAHSHLPRPERAGRRIGDRRN
jgi:carnitine 3-dehydrogenase